MEKNIIKTVMRKLEQKTKQNDTHKNKARKKQGKRKKDTTLVKVLISHLGSRTRQRH